MGNRAEVLESGPTEATDYPRITRVFPSIVSPPTPTSSTRYSSSTPRFARERKTLEVPALLSTASMWSLKSSASARSPQPVQDIDEREPPDAFWLQGRASTQHADRLPQMGELGSCAVMEILAGSHTIRKTLRTLPPLPYKGPQALALGKTTALYLQIS